MATPLDYPERVSYEWFLREYEGRGVREYRLIDPYRKTFDVFRRTDQDRFERVDLGVPPRVTTEHVPGIWIDPEWLWQEPTPGLVSVLRLWGLL